MRLNLKERWSSYIEPWQLVSWSASFLLKAILPSWLGGTRVEKGVKKTDYAFGELLKNLGHHFVAYEDTTAVPKLVPQAQGLVLELGPGTGNQLHRFKPSSIKHIYGIEPNPLFKAPLQAKITKTKLDDKYTLITGSVDDETLLARHGISEGSLDCILSIQVLCSVENPKETAKLLWKLLKPGGMLIFWEHHRSHDWVSRIMQALWNPVWSTTIGGCKLDTPLMDLLLAAGSWQEVDIEGDEKPWFLMPRVWGKLVKKVN